MGRIIMAIVNNIFKEAIEDAGGRALSKIGNEIIKGNADDIARKALGEASTATLSKLGTKIPVTMTTDFPNDFYRVAVRVGKNGGAKKVGSELAEKASNLGLRKNKAGKWVMDTSKWDTEGVSELENFMKPILGGEGSDNYKRFMEQIGEGDYMMSHRPDFINDETGSRFPTTLDNIEGNGDILPKVYGDSREDTIRGLLRLGGSGDEHLKSANVIADYRGKPNEMVTIYRQSPKDFNYGDWVALNDSYVDMHIGNSPDNKLWSKQVPANEVYFAGDDINEWGWFPKEVELDDAIGNEINKAISGLEGAGYLQPKQLYHQTSASSLGDMTLDRRAGIFGDSGMPEGIFLKETPEDIGLMGKNQLALDARMENPAYFKDRAELDEFIRSRGGNDLMSRRKEIDDYYQKLSDELEKKAHEAAVISYNNPTPENKALTQKAMDDWQKVADEWSKAIDDNDIRAREGIRNTLVNNGYDSAIIENDAGSGGRSVKSYIVFDKNQLSPRYDGANFDPNDVNSVFKAAGERQKNLDSSMDSIVEKLKNSGINATYRSGGNKSISSMNDKVARKMASGRDYRIMDMKDHMRGAVMLDSLNNGADEITTLLEEMQYALDQAVGIEAIESNLGYTGLHLTWRDKDGLGYEIQVTTPEVWKTKKASDKLYKEVRNWTEEDIMSDPAKMKRLKEIEAQSKALWNNLWERLGGKPDLKSLESFNDDIYYY